MAADPSRIGSAGDVAEVAGLLDRFNREFDEFTPGAEALEPRVREHVERGLSVFLLAGPRDVGIAQLRFRDYLHTGTAICTVDELYVVPDRRGERHGRGLMEHAFDVARERGATTIELNTTATDTAAVGLYESLAFTNLERQDRPETRMLYYEREL